ncbi:MAG: PEP-CTERM sorting domain-containing protein, partial [Phycisphaerae bacterium]
RYTLYGNANLDDRVDAADLNKVLINYGEILADPGDIMPWFLGNFNYDDRVDAADLNRVLVNWATLEADVGLGGSPVPLGAAGGSAPMPEPATLALLALGAGAMFRRRRTR